MADDDKIGLRAEINAELVEAGVEAYAKALARMEGQTDSSGGAMSGVFDAVESAWHSMAGGFDAGKEIVTGALRRVGEIATDALAEAARAMADFAIDSFKGAIDAQKGIDELNATIENLGDASPITAERALELADQFKNLAGGSDDAVLAAQKVLLRFDEIGADVFPRVLEQSADLATVFGGDMAGGAEKLGKVLNDLGTDGEASFKSLRAAGVELTEQQKKQILAMVKAGDVAGAQNALLDALAATTGGAAAAASETLAGKWAIFQEAVADAGEGVMLELMPALTVLADKVLPAIMPAVEAIAGALSDFFARIVTGEDPVGSFANLVYTLGNALGLDGEGLFNAVINLREPFESLMGSLSGIGDAVGWAVSNLSGGGGLVETLQGLSDFSWEDMLGEGLGATVTRLIDTVATFAGDVQTNLPIVQAAFADAWAAIQPALTELWTVISTEVMPTIANLTKDANTQLPTVKQVFEVVAAAIVVAANLFSGVLTNVVIPIIRTVVDYVATQWPRVQATIETVMAAAEDIINTVLTGIQQFWNEWGDEIQAFTESIFNAVKDIFSAFNKAFSGDWRGFGEDLRKAWDGIWKAIETAAKDAIDAILKIDWGQLGQDIIKGIAAGLTASVQWIKDAARAAAQAALEAAKGFLGINSPSYVFQTEVGEMAGEGWANGMLDAVSDVIAASRELARSAVTSGIAAFDSLRSDWLSNAPGLSTGVARPMAGATYNNTFVYQYSPTYGSAPVAPSQDFALMGVFNGV